MCEMPTVSTTSDTSPHVASVDGLRALSILWTICFHVVFFGGYQVTESQYRAWLQHPLGAAMAKGSYGVDVFFVISGYLIARLLLSEIDTPAGLRPVRFYFRRLMRIFPAYLVTLWIGKRFWGADSHSENVWANLLLINNFLTFDQQTLGWTWSLAVEEQFYVVFPLLLMAACRIRNRCGWFLHSRHYVVLWAFLAALLVRGLLVFYADTTWIQEPDPFHPQFDLGNFRRYFDAIYDKPYGRCGGIICGIWVACCEKDSAFLLRLSRHRALARVLLVAAFLYLGCEIFGGATLHGRSPSQSLRSSVSVIFDTYLFTLMIGYVLLYVVAMRGTGKISMIDRVLSWRGFRSIAKLSYSAYLLHPMVILLLWSRMHWDLQHRGAVLLMEHALLSIILTHLSAVVLYLLVERPMHRLGRRVSG